ncbi:S8 family serine peptidase [Deinococcus grandis]|uniref:S8 family serine peptidase n=1 Tax=Deinococcus grandis TaxID=57498 RepID=UPI000A9B82D0|nr:S8 family serine peptidase [Deinococcus grandis]BBN94289.1 hypothetical protein DEGR_10220 [Deinococcus grandis]
MNRYLMTGLLGFLGLAYAAQVQPTTAPPGTSLRLTLTDGIQVDDPKLFIGAHKLDATKVPNSDGKQWDFKMPVGVLPGPQPIQLRSEGKEPTRVLSWVTALRNSEQDQNSIVVVSRKSADTFKIQDKIFQLSKNLVNTNSKYIPDPIKELIKGQIKSTPLNIELLKNDVRGKIYIPGEYIEGFLKNNATPQQKIEQVRQLQLEALKIKNSDQLRDFQKSIEVAATGSQGQQLNFNGYTSKVFLDPIGGTQGKSGVSIAYFKQYVEPSQRSDGNICQQKLFRISFTGKDAAIFKAISLSLLSQDKDFWIDPTGYGIPSQTTPPQQQTQIATQMQYSILQANVRQLNHSGLFDNGRIVYPDGGKGVTVFVIDSDSSVAKTGDKSDGLNLHGDAITRIIKTMAPGAVVVQRHACANGICRIEDIVSALCDAANAAPSGKVIVNLSLNTPYPSEMLAEAMRQVTDNGGLIVTAHGNNYRCRINGSQPGSLGVDYCNAYPADWTGEPSSLTVSPPSVMNHTDWKGRLYSVGAWDISKNSPAIYNRDIREKLSDGYRTIAPTYPKLYAPGTFFFKFRDVLSSEFAGTSFAAPAVSAMFATWWTTQNKAAVPDFIPKVENATSERKYQAQPLMYKLIQAANIH